jgi:hypothetical protein
MKITAAHVPVIILSVVLVAAVILGIATGSLNENTLKTPTPQPWDKITVP